jgi:hypothetical protein
MYCPNCGAHNDDDAVYCEECGAAMAASELPAAVVEEALPKLSIEEEPIEGLDELGLGLDEFEAVPIAPEDVDEDDWPVEAEPDSAPVYPPQPVRAPGVPTSGMAIASFLLGIGGLTILPLLGSVLALVLGYMARKDIRQRPTVVSGEGLAVAGIVMGWVVVGATALIAILTLLGVVASICGFGLCGMTGG